MEKRIFDLYLASCTPAGGVLHAGLTENGELLPLDFVKMPQPMFLAFGDGGIYALLRDPFGNGESALTHFPLCGGTPGKPGKLLSTGGRVACHLSVYKGKVYAANYTSGSVARLDYETGEVLLDVHTGNGPDPDRQKGSHTHFIAPAPDGKFLLATDLGTDRVFTYSEDLKPLFAAPVPAGHGARHLAYSADGKFIYCANELQNTVTVFTYENGVLTPRQTVDALPGVAATSSKAAAIRLRGDRLYVSHRGDDSIAILSACGEKLEFLKKVPCGGKSPRDMDFFGDFLVCTNEGDGAVTVFRREGDDLSYCSSLSLDVPLCVIGR